MTYVPFDPLIPYTYEINRTAGREVVTWSLEEVEARYIEDRENLFDTLEGLKEGLDCTFEVTKCQRDHSYALCLDYPTDRMIMKWVKEYNPPCRYTVQGFDRDTGKGNYSLGTCDTLEDAKRLILSIQEREGEDAPIMIVGARYGGDCFTYHFLDELDSEEVESWNITGV